MIATLLAEQFRSQRAYAVWTATILTAAVTLVSLGWSLFISESRQADAANEVEGLAANYHAIVVDTTSYPDELGPAADWGVPMSHSDLSAFLDTANGEGAQAAAVTTLGGSDAFAATDPALAASVPDGAWTGTVAAISGWWPWADVLADGSAPGPEEIALPAWTVQAQGLELGDPVTWATAQLDDSAAGATVRTVETLTLSGVVYDSPYVAAETAPYSGVAFVDPTNPHLADQAVAATLDPSGVPWMPVTYDVTWRQSTPTTHATFPDSGPLTTSYVSSAVAVWGLAALAVTFLAAVMAFAVGRAQAHRRQTWTATARALGATRGLIVSATLVEGAILGAVAAVLGLAAGAATAAGIYAAQTSDLAAAPPLGVPVSGPMLALVTLGALALGVGMAAVPAVFAARVTPAQALTGAPIAPERSRRRVPSWVPLTGFAVSFGALLWLAWKQFEVNAALAWTVAIALPVFAISATVETARLLVGAYSRWLSRRAEPQAVVAGLELTAHPAQASALMVVQVLSMGLVALTSVAGVLFGIPVDFSSLSTSDVVAALPWMAVAQAVCFAIFAGTRRVTADADATVGALGAAPGASALATIARFGVPQAMGATVGSVVAGACGWLLVVAGPGSDGSMDSATVATFGTTVVLHVCVALFAALIVIAVGTAVQAWLTSRRARSGRGRPSSRHDVKVTASR